LAAIRPELEAFMFKIREQGIPLTNRMVEREAARILPVFKHKTVRAKAVEMHRFTRSVRLTQHAATHTAQKHFTVTENDVKDFIAMMRMKIQGRDPNDILNMDQMPIPYSYHSNKMLEVIGLKPVQQRSSTSETKCVFRRNKFGQPRDMLEQRQLSKFFVADPTTGKTAVTSGPVVIQFVSGTTSWQRARTYATASLETSFNKKDSGIYDYEYRSGQPFFDDQIGLVD
jgi:hypothetical protein